jgi:hypothetical protein
MWIKTPHMVAGTLTKTLDKTIFSRFKLKLLTDGKDEGNYANV